MILEHDYDVYVDFTIDAIDDDRLIHTYTRDYPYDSSCIDFWDPKHSISIICYLDCLIYEFKFFNIPHFYFEYTI